MTYPQYPSGCTVPSAGRKLPQLLGLPEWPIIRSFVGGTIGMTEQIVFEVRAASATVMPTVIARECLTAGRRSTTAFRSESRAGARRSDPAVHSGGFDGTDLPERALIDHLACSRGEVLSQPQLTAFFTSAPILVSSAAVNSFSAKAVGHMKPSSRVALSLKPNVAYLVLNFCELWKKQTTVPSLA